MGYREIELKLPTGYDETYLAARIRKTLKIGTFSHQVILKSLDARNKGSILWILRLGVLSEELKGGAVPQEEDLAILNRKRHQRAIVLGSGPAGFFAALVLQRSGFDTVILERGADVGRREQGISSFEKTGIFDPLGNYAFGEGGAGTFSDGKLTSRSKHITREKQFILNSYIRAGAPEEIAYLAFPHVGSDNLKVVIANLRKEFCDLGGRILFETKLENLRISNGRVVSAVTGKGILDAEIFLLAPGHSAYETYRMLMGCGVPFETKNFALGFRVEHPQELINLSQWGRPALPGVKAAEYRLTSNRPGRLPVFTFCMCPGGIVVPATPYAAANLVNGMSLYKRDGSYANAACVAGIHPDMLAGNRLSASATLDWLESLEESFYTFSNSYRAPYLHLRDFLQQKESRGPAPASSYPLGLLPSPLWKMLPSPVVTALSEGIQDFGRKLKGFETGILLGLESKTSSPIRVVRDENGRCQGFKNLYMAGEGSGYSGGIISSAADGIRVAMAIAGSG